MIIYKIFRPGEWDELRQKGTTLGAPIDVADGYVHFSTAEQVRETAAKHFANAGDLVLLACDTDALGADLTWEISRGDALFPHLYRPLNMADVAWNASLLQGPDGHIFPEGI
jgi:uncharacterized protein (DUF952 family)